MELPKFQSWTGSCLELKVVHVKYLLTEKRIVQIMMRLPLAKGKGFCALDHMKYVWKTPTSAIKKV